MSDTDIKVLLVEDNMLAIIAARAALEEHQCQVDLAKTGEEAVAKASSHYYDLILMDLGLPGIQGDEAAKTIKQQNRNSHTKILALSAHDEPDQHHQAEKAGIDGFLSKPLTADKCTYLLTTFINHKFPQK